MTIKKIYITGVTGFIGSNIAKRCLKKGYQVIGICRKNGSIIKRELQIDIIEADFLNNDILELDKADAVIHCATANDILSKNESLGLSLSIIGTSKLLNACIKSKIDKVIFLSTAQVYGTELSGYLDELTPINCKTSYALNHFLGEELCRFYSETKNFDISILRPSNVYGLPDVSTVERSTLVPKCFIDEAIKLGSITLRSSGKQTRNFISTDQLSEMALSILDDFPTGYTIRNCGSNWNSSIIEIANLVAYYFEKHFEKKLKIFVDSEIPNNSNIFQYNSKFFDYEFSEIDCKNNMKIVVEQLFADKKKSK